jgi:hypothetical protein
MRIYFPGSNENEEIFILQYTEKTLHEEKKNFLCLQGCKVVQESQWKMLQRNH